MTRVEFERVANKFLFMNQTEFKEVMKDPKLGIFDLLIGRIFQAAIVEGDERRLGFILDRLIGKVVTPISGPNGESLPIVQILLPSNGREAPHLLKTRQHEVIEAESHHVKDDV